MKSAHSIRCERFYYKHLIIIIPLALSDDDYAVLFPIYDSVYDVDAPAPPSGQIVL